MTTNTNTRTAGQAFGALIGATAAHTVHFVAVAATATGRFGADTVDGVTTGYQTTAAMGSAERMARGAARLAAQQPVTPIGITLTA